MPIAPNDSSNFGTDCPQLDRIISNRELLLKGGAPLVVFLVWGLLLSRGKLVRRSEQVSSLIFASVVDRLLR